MRGGEVSRGFGREERGKKQGALRFRGTEAEVLQGVLWDVLLSVGGSWWVEGGEPERPTLANARNELAFFGRGESWGKVPVSVGVRIHCSRCGWGGYGGIGWGSGSAGARYEKVGTSYNPYSHASAIYNPRAPVT